MLLFTVKSMSPMVLLLEVMVVKEVMFIYSLLLDLPLCHQ